MRHHHQHARAAPAAQRGQRAGGLLGLSGRVAEEGVEVGVVTHLPGEGQLGGLARAAPLRAEHRSHLHALAAKQLADAACLCPAGGIEVALGAAVVEPEAGRVADAGGLRVSEEHDAAVFQRGPGRVRGRGRGSQRQQHDGQGEAKAAHGRRLRPRRLAARPACGHARRHPAAHAAGRRCATSHGARARSGGRRHRPRATCARACAASAACRSDR